MIDKEPRRAGDGKDLTYMGRRVVRCLRLSLEPVLSEVEKARGLVDDIGALVPLSDARAFDMKVVLSEACANGIEHASSRVGVVVWLLHDRILLEVTNDGWSLPGVRRDRERNHRGFGLPLMTALADQVHISRLGGELARVSLTFFLSPKALELPEQERSHLLGLVAADCTNSPEICAEPPSPEATVALISDGPARRLSPLEHMAEVIEAVASAPTLPAAAAALLDGAMTVTKCQSGMLRMKESVAQGAGWLPAIVHRGLNKEFLREEALIRTDECMCGRVSVSLTDPSLPFFTPGGSFVWGRAQTIADQFGMEVLGEVRGRCVAEGFESVAVFPLLTKAGPIGSLHLADLQNDKFDQTFAAVEWGCRVCGPIMMRSSDTERIAAIQDAIATLRAS